MSIIRITKKDKDTKARLGILSLPHGEVETPAFMPVGTNGTVKGIYHDTIRKIGYRLILANTYHLYLRPGTEVLEDFGGLHGFSAWDGNILTDSGGFQVFSLSGLRKVRESGVTFQSHIDGSKHIFTPEKVVDIQSIIGSDIAMVLDVCTPPGIEHRNAEEAWRVTKLWAERSIEERNRLGEKFRGNLFGIGDVLFGSENHHVGGSHAMQVLVGHGLDKLDRSHGGLLVKSDVFFVILGGDETSVAVVVTGDNVYRLLGI